MYATTTVLARTTRTARRTFVFAVIAVCVHLLVVEGVIIGVISTQYDVIMLSPSRAFLLSNNILPTAVSSCWP